MADERIEVEWIATAQQMVGVLQKIEQRFDKQEQQLQKLAQTSTKAADAAAGSFNELEQELKDNEAQLKKLTMGTAEWAAQKNKVDALKNSLAGAKDQMKTVGTGIGESLSSGVAKMAQLAAGMIGFHATISAIVGELQDVLNMRMAAAASRRTVEQSLAAMAINLPQGKAEAAKQMIQEQAPALGVTQEGLASLIADGMSGGAKDIGESMRLATATLKLTAGNADTARPLMGGMLSLAATTGNRNFEQILGQLSQFQQAGRGVDMSMSINNMATAMAAANIKGQRVEALGGERTLEFGAAISQILQDPTMAVTGTTLRQMMTKMDSFVAKTSTTLDDGTKSTLTKEAVESFNKLDTVDERMAAMQGNAELAKQFLSKIEDNQGKAAVRALVTGDAGAMAKLREAEQIVTGGEGGQQKFDQLVQDIAALTPALQSQNRQAAVIQSEDVMSGLEGEVAVLFENALKENLVGANMLQRLGAKGALAVRENIGGQQVAEAAAAVLREAQGPDLIGNESSRRTARVLEATITEIERLGKLIRAENEKIQAGKNGRINVNVQAPAARPKEAPLPAATVP